MIPLVVGEESTEHHSTGSYCIEHKGVRITDRDILSIAVAARVGWFWCDQGHYKHVDTARLAWIRRLAEGVLVKLDHLPINILLPLGAALAAALGIAVMHHHWAGHQEVWDHFGCWARYQVTYCTTPPQF